MSPGELERAIDRARRALASACRRHDPGTIERQVARRALEDLLGERERQRDESRFAAARARAARCNGTPEEARRAEVERDLEVRERLYRETRE